jgi:lipoprotein-anchoring transpeptidase ErfK/SrfK
MTGYTRRRIITGLAVALAAPRLARAHQVTLPDHFNPTAVQTGRTDWLPGDIHVVPDEFHLYLMGKDGAAIRYGVGVGRKGLYESGVFTVARKAKWPWWRPTQSMIRRDPGKYAKYKNGMKGGPNNPLGARALYLHDDQGRDTYLRIHGTNAPSTIGSAVSNGCARLTNEHVKDLYERVEIGARVTLHPKVTTA